MCYNIRRLESAVKNKRLIILLSIFAFIILIVVLSSTVFTVHATSISVEWHISPLQFMQGQDKEIVGEIVDKENIIFYDKNQAISTLEEKYPYIKVLKIEKKFPNKIIVHATERQEQYAIKVNEKYYVLDEEGKVLNSYDQSGFDALGATPNRRPLVVSISGMTIEESTMQIGKYAEISRVITILKNLSSGLKNSGYTETWQVINNFKSVSIELGYVSKLSLDTNAERNITLIINDVNKNLSAKVRFGVGLLNSRDFADKTNCNLTISYNSEGKLIGDRVDK